jgi:hypothetical protein
MHAQEDARMNTSATVNGLELLQIMEKAWTKTGKERTPLAEKNGPLQVRTSPSTYETAMY